LASLATHAISSTAGAATHGHGGKLHIKSDSGESFADLLAALEDANADDQTALTAAAGQTTQPTAQAQAAGDGDVEDDADAAPEVTAALPSSLIAPGAVQTKPADTTTGKADSKSDDAKPAANDNDGTQQPLPALPQPLLPAPQPQVQAQTPVQTQSQDQTVAPLAANAAAPSQAAAASQADEADQNEGANEPATAPQAAATTDKPAPAAAKKPDFKKILDDTKPTAAKPATADTAPARDADAGKDASKADVRQADAALPQAPAAHAGNQTNIQPDALAANAPAAANTVQHANAAAQTLPTTAPHQAANLQGLAVEIAARSQSGSKQFDIRLDPPELGRVDVRLSIDATGKAQAHLTADQPQTLDLLQKDAPALTRALREAGLDVNQDGLNFSLRQQQQQTGQDQAQSQSHRTLRAGFTGATNNETAPAGAAYSSRGLGLLDIRV
jgi:flagellar hook-length control protein FliK